MWMGKGRIVDLDLSVDQSLFLGTTRRFLTANWTAHAVRDLADDPMGFDRTVWDQGASLGWTSMLVPERHGGGSISGEGVADLAIVAEELGRFLFMGPVLPSNVVAFALARWGTEEQASAFLPGLVSGAEIAAWAVFEETDRWGAGDAAIEAVPRGGRYRLSGVMAPVQDAHLVNHLLVSARTAGGVTQFLVPSQTPGVSISPLRSLDLARRFSRVSFDHVDLPSSAAVGVIDGASAAIDSQLALALALQCAETVGATDRAFEMTLTYVKDRKSFGRPIGSYQALKHRLADMLLWLESAKAATVAAVGAVQSDIDAGYWASLAKSYIGDHCPAIVRDCLQMHGGIGYTWEHDLHLYLRRVESNALIYGRPDHHRDRLAGAVGFEVEEARGR
jgi:alkylation response protein AidB-like acyl-CoA dehydrogenase